MNTILRTLFFTVLVRFVVTIVLGLNIRHRERLPKKGPAIIVANHNSHLDTMVLVTLFPSKILKKVMPVAAMDYFMTSPFLTWFSTRIIGILPLNRGKVSRHTDPLAGCNQALIDGNILILFPEGSRGEPEQLSQFKSGVAHLADKNPGVPVIPIFMHGLGKALPKGEKLLVPFYCDVFVGDPLPKAEHRKVFMNNLNTAMEHLAAEGSFPTWD